MQHCFTLRSVSIPVTLLLHLLVSLLKAWHIQDSTSGESEKVDLSSIASRVTATENQHLQTVAHESWSNRSTENVSSIRTRNQSPQDSQNSDPSYIESDRFKYPLQSGSDVVPKIESSAIVTPPRRLSATEPLQTAAVEITQRQSTIHSIWVHNVTRIAEGLYAEHTRIEAFWNLIRHYVSPQSIESIGSQFVSFISGDYSTLNSDELVGLISRCTLELTPQSVGNVSAILTKMWLLMNAPEDENLSHKIARKFFKKYLTKSGMDGEFMFKGFVEVSQLILPPGSRESAFDPRDFGVVFIQFLRRFPRTISASLQAIISFVSTNPNVLDCISLTQALYLAENNGLNSLRSCLSQVYRARCRHEESLEDWIAWVNRLEAFQLHKSKSTFIAGCLNMRSVFKVALNLKAHLGERTFQVNALRNMRARYLIQSTSIPDGEKFVEILKIFFSGISPENVLEASRIIISTYDYNGQGSESLYWALLNILSSRVQWSRETAKMIYEAARSNPLFTNMHLLYQRKLTELISMLYFDSNSSQILKKVKYIQAMTDGTPLDFANDVFIPSLSYSLFRMPTLNQSRFFHIAVLLWKGSDLQIVLAGMLLICISQRSRISCDTVVVVEGAFVDGTEDLDIVYRPLLLYSLAFSSEPKDWIEADLSGVVWQDRISRVFQEALEIGFWSHEKEGDPPVPQSATEVYSRGVRTRSARVGKIIMTYAANGLRHGRGVLIDEVPTECENHCSVCISSLYENDNGEIYVPNAIVQCPHSEGKHAHHADCIVGSVLHRGSLVVSCPNCRMRQLVAPSSNPMDYN